MNFTIGSRASQSKDAITVDAMTFAAPAARIVSWDLHDGDTLQVQSHAQGGKKIADRIKDLAND